MVLKVLALGVEARGDCTQGVRVVCLPKIIDRSGKISCEKEVWSNGSTPEPGRIEIGETKSGDGRVDAVLLDPQRLKVHPELASLGERAILLEPFDVERGGGQSRELRSVELGLDEVVQERVGVAEDDVAAVHLEFRAEAVRIRPSEANKLGARVQLEARLPRR